MGTYSVSRAIMSKIILAEMKPFDNQSLSINTESTHHTKILRIPIFYRESPNLIKALLSLRVI